MVIAFGLSSTGTTNPMPWKSQSQPQHSGCTKDLNAVIRGGQAEIICRKSCGGTVARTASPPAVHYLSVAIE
jgi:hypothetical protein